MTPLEQLRNLARGKVHAGYRWAMVADDGQYICEKCVRENYRTIYKATRWPKTRPNSGWQCIGVENSGDCEDEGWCAHCDKLIFEGREEDYE
jgi:hypothetical protein